jgi:hypothetical protein
MHAGLVFLIIFDKLVTLLPDAGCPAAIDEEKGKLLV